MKTPFLLGLALLVAAVPAQAQLFRPSLNGAVLGGIAGAIIGNNSGSLHHNAWQGAAIGAGAGLLLEAAAGYPRPVGGAVTYGGPYVYRGRYGYNGHGSAAADGLWLGALAGGVIERHDRGFRHDGWRGAAWGAGVGWLLGSVIDANAYDDSYPPRVIVREAPVMAAAQPAPAPQQVTIINNYYNTPATPMTAANGLFGRN